MSNSRLLVLGTRNRKKRLELEGLLRQLDLEIRSIDDFAESLDVEETGHTFQENARLKACVQARHLNQWVLGEDSGLSVDALDGTPGIHSSRYAGPHATDDENNRRLVEALKSVPPEKRTAMYTCHMTLSDPQGNPVVDVEEICRGRIISEPRGSTGFGYDPYFELPEYHQTFAELGEAVKSVLSHRARAMRRFLAICQSRITLFAGQSVLSP